MPLRQNQCKRPRHRSRRPPLPRSKLRRSKLRHSKLRQFSGPIASAEAAPAVAGSKLRSSRLQRLRCRPASLRSRPRSCRRWFKRRRHRISSAQLELFLPPVPMRKPEVPATAPCSWRGFGASVPGHRGADASLPNAQARTAGRRDVSTGGSRLRVAPALVGVVEPPSPPLPARKPDLPFDSHSAACSSPPHQPALVEAPSPRCRRASLEAPVTELPLRKLEAPAAEVPAFGCRSRSRPCLCPSQRHPPRLCRHASRRRRSRMRRCRCSWPPSRRRPSTEALLAAASGAQARSTGYGSAGCDLEASRGCDACSRNGTSAAHAGAQAGAAVRAVADERAGCVTPIRAFSRISPATIAGAQARGTRGRNRSHSSGSGRGRSARRGSSSAHPGPKAGKPHGRRAGVARQSSLYRREWNRLLWAGRMHPRPKRP